jgi:RNA polymerase sigma-54 factor
MDTYEAPFDELVSDLNSSYNLNVNENDIERVLKIINKLEPIGLGSRDIKECLTIQLKELDIEPGLKDLCIKMINSFFDEFSHKHFEKLMKELDVSKEKLIEMFEVIHKLNPYPGSGGCSDTKYIYPDFIVLNQAMRK